MLFPELIITGQTLKKLYRDSFQTLKSEWRLTQIEIDILLYLANNPVHNTARDISERRGLAKSQVSQAIEVLSSRGLLQAQADPADRRRAHLRICVDALPITGRARELQRVFWNAMLAGISPADRDHLKRTLAQIMKNAREGLPNVD